MAMLHKKIDLNNWIEQMRLNTMHGDDIALYLLCHMCHIGWLVQPKWRTRVSPKKIKPRAKANQEGTARERVYELDYEHIEKCLTKDLSSGQAKGTNTGS